MSQNRPLSPHLQVYRWQITAVLSILHRITGIALAFASLLLTIWLVCLAYGEESWAYCMALYKSAPGEILFSSILFAFFYHCLNGIRHLFWDCGYGFEMKTTKISGWFVVLLTFSLTALTLWRIS